MGGKLRTRAPGAGAADAGDEQRETVSLRELRQPDRADEPAALPASAATITLRAPLLRPEAVLDLQQRTGWREDELVAILGGRACADKASGRPVRAASSLEDPAAVSDAGAVVSGPLQIGGWIGPGRLTSDLLYVPERELRRSAVLAGEPEDVFEALWREVQAHGATSATSLRARLAADVALFRRVFVARSYGVQAILHAAGLAPAPRPIDDDVLAWPRRLAEVAGRVAPARRAASTPAQRGAAAAAETILRP